MKPKSPTVRLAHFDVPAVHLALEKGSSEPNQPAPALLVSFVYLKQFVLHRQNYAYRDWVLDSGAFSAHASGTVIELNRYIETCKELAATDKTLTEVFALDVIGDHKASLHNCEKMWEAGVEAIPCFHFGEPEDALLAMAKEYPKIAIGGVARMKGSKKMAFAEQCFARVWPKRIHGFGFGAEEQILGLPWHSVDATNWELGPTKFGRWQKFGSMSVRGSTQNLSSEVRHYLAIERRAQAKWKKEMELLGGLTSVRLALSGIGDKTTLRLKSIGAPTVRLAVAASPRPIVPLNP